ncbi:MAG: hypothetical protein Q9215_006259 [Flavoplaca cf. flavocitrina]
MFFNWDNVPFFDFWFKQLDGRSVFTANQINSLESNPDLKLNVIQCGVNLVQATVESAEETLESHFEVTGERIDELETKIDNIDDIVERRFEHSENWRDKKFSRLHGYTEERLKALEEKVQRHLDDSRALSRNALCTQGWQQIEPLSASTYSRGSKVLPQGFPENVRRFWRLKDRSNSDALTELLQYYGIQGYQYWDQEEKPVAPVSLARLAPNANLPPMLRKAVHAHPEIAHRALAMQLGLNYENIQASMEGEPVVDRREPEVITGDENTVLSRGRKRRREEASEAEGTSAAEQTTGPAPRRSRRKATR